MRNETIAYARRIRTIPIAAEIIIFLAVALLSSFKNEVIYNTPAHIKAINAATPAIMRIIFTKKIIRMF